MEADASAGAILRKIKREETWREEFDTWEKFCLACTDFRKRHVDQMIQDAETRENLALALHGMGTTVPKLSSNATEELAKSGPPEVQAEIVVELQNSNQPINRTTVKNARTKLATPVKKNPATGVLEPQRQPEQLELSFLVIAPPSDIEWFKSLTKERRGEIITEARHRQ